MQRAYISALLELAEKDNNVLHLIADSGTGYDEMFRMNFPEQIYDFGIAEEHMVAAAAGMATAGKIPFVYTAGAFLAYRSLEFIRDDICFQKQNVKVVGMGSGLAWSTLGPSHHTTEDIAVLRAIPNLTILSPASPIQVSCCVKKAYEILGPVYIRIGMNNERELFDDQYEYVFGKNEIIVNGGDITIFSTGSIIDEVLQAIDLLEKIDIHANLVNIHTIKPFDKQNILEMAMYSKLFITVEEHNIYGGLGSIISEIITEEGIAKKVIRIGLNDQFAEGYGTQHSVRAENSLDSYGIYNRIKEIMNE